MSNQVANPRYDNLDLLKAISIFVVVTLHGSVWNYDFLAGGEITNVIQYAVRNILEGLPLFIQPTVYDDGNYNNVDSNAKVELTSPQKEEGTDKATGVKNNFMTTADVPYLAMNGVIEKPINPFTNKPITVDEKTAHDQLISMSNDWDVAENNGEEFMPSRWASVKDNIWDVSNWKVSNEKTILKEHKLP